MALSALVDSFLPQLEKCGNERVKDCIRRLGGLWPLIRRLQRASGRKLPPFCAKGALPPRVYSQLQYIFTKIGCVTMCTCTPEFGLVRNTQPQDNEDIHSQT